MGTLVIGTIVDEARDTLLEIGPADERWQRTGNLLDHGNRAISEIVAAFPLEGTRNEPFLLDPGAKQTIPTATGGFMFLGAEHNLGSTGLSPGAAILKTDRSALTRANRNWMATTGAYVQNFVHDERDPIHFYVYPQVNPWYINLLYAAVPTPISAADIDHATNGLISVSDRFRAAIHDYIVGYALLKTSKIGDPARGAFWMQKFYAQIGKTFDAQIMNAPLDPEADARTPGDLGKA